MRTVLVTSAGSGVGRAIADAARLSAHPYRVVGLDSGKRDIGAVRVPPTDSGAEFRSAVLTVARDHPNSLILAGRDPDIDILVDLAPQLVRCGTTFTSGPAVAVTASLDKARTQEVLGLGTHFAATATTVDGALRMAARRGWPLVVKPRRGSASRGIRFPRCASGLSETMTAQDVAQEFLPLLATDRRPWDGSAPGGQDGEYSLQVVLGPGSELLGVFAGRHCLVDGRPVLVEVLDRHCAALAIEVLLQCLQTIGATGCWNFQGRMSQSGVRYFEVNSRTTGITGLRAALGFNELDLLYESFVLRRTPARHRALQPAVVDATDWTAPSRLSADPEVEQVSATRLTRPV